MKLNKANYMDHKYEVEKWYKFDILLDWDLSQIAIFVNGTYITKVDFYSKDRDVLMQCDEFFVNTLMLYNLTPGTITKFKGIRMCTDLCPGTQESDFPLMLAQPEPDVKGIDPYKQS